jgi:hypothetical protein
MFMPTCYRHHAIICECATCQISSCDARNTHNTHNAHLRHVTCRLDDGHRTDHEYEIDGKIVTEPTDKIFIGVLKSTDPERRDIIVQAWKGYGVTIPSEVTTNGSVWGAARCVAHRLTPKGGYTWDGPPLQGTTAEGIARTLCLAYYEAFPSEYEVQVKFHGKDPRGPRFQWPEVQTEPSPA